MSQDSSTLQEIVARLGAALAREIRVVEPLHARAGLACRVRSGGDDLLLKLVDTAADDPAASRRGRSLQREGELLADLDARTGARHVAHGRLGSTVWLLRRWVEGVGAWQHVAYLRGSPPPSDARHRFVADLCRIFRTVSRLDALGYLHGDLQPNHFIADGEGRFHLIDLELAIRKDAPKSGYPGALVHFVSPETAAGMLVGDDNIPLDAVSEIYSLGAVAFFLYTGRTAVAYGASLEGVEDKGIAKEQKLIAISQGRTRSFAQAGAEPFPALERALSWFLEMDRRRRCPSLNAAIAALEGISTGQVAR